LKAIGTEQVNFQIISLFIIDLIIMDFIYPRKYLVTRMVFYGII